MAITWKKILVLLLICGAVAVVVLVPEVRARAKGLFRKAAEEVYVEGESEPTIYGSPKVYVVRGDDTYYHRGDCPQIKGKGAVPRPLNEAGQLYQPCPLCKPPR